MSRTSEIFKYQQLQQKKIELEGKLQVQYVPKTNEVKLYGNMHTYNMPPMIAENIYESYYFHRLLDIQTFEDVCEEARNSLKDVEPLVVGTSRHPSTAFCILLKFFMYRLSYTELFDLLKEKKCLYLRCIGFLYIRYGIEPKDLWKWLSPYFDEGQLFAPSHDKSYQITIGEYVQRLIDEKNYYSILLSSIPIPLKREMSANIIKLNVMKDLPRIYTNKQATHPVAGAHVKALYSADMQWYPAVIVSDNKDDTYCVMYEGYGNKETRARYHILVEGEELDLNPDSKKESAVDDYRSKDKERNTYKDDSKDEYRDPSRDRYNHSHSHNHSPSEDRRVRSHSRDNHRSHHSHNRGYSREDSHSHRSHYRDYSRGHSRDTRSRRRSSRSPSDGSYRHRDRYSRSPVRHVSPDLLKHGDLDNNKLLELVREKERDNVVAHGRHYADTVKHQKAMFMVKQDTFTGRKRSRSTSIDRHYTRITQEPIASSPTASPKPKFEPTERLENLINKYGASKSDYKDNYDD
ncbi:hypothetical protein WA158_007032 [Blastocystis sp. Blastoise]